MKYLNSRAEPHLLGRSERGAGANSGGNKRFIAKARIRVDPHLTRDAKENIILGRPKK